MSLKRLFSLMFFFCYFLHIYTNIWSQESPPSTIAGPQLINPGDSTTLQNKKKIVDAQLYMPETFSPTATLPISKVREDLEDTALKRKKPISRKYFFGITIAAQYGQYSKLPYTDIIFSPYLKLQEFIFAYECPLRFDWNGSFVSKMWKGSIALASKIESEFFYEKSNKIFESFLFRIGTSDNLILGHGRFVYDYKPNLYGPYETFKTLNIELNTSMFSIKYILANLAIPDIMCTEFSVMPCGLIQNERLTFFKKFRIYVLYGIDLNPFRGFSPGLYEAPARQSSLGFAEIESGFLLPIWETKKRSFALDLYTDFSHILNQKKSSYQIHSGSGISGGFLITIIDRIPFRFEISKAFGRWEPRWVNVFYNIDSVYINLPDNLIENKIMKMSSNSSFFTGSIGFNWVNKGIFSNLELFGNFKETLWVTVSLNVTNKLIQLLSLSFVWTTRTTTGKLDGKYNPSNSILEIKATYHMLKNMTWGVLWKMNGQIGETFDANNTKSIIGIKRFIFIGIDFSYRF